MAKRVAANGRSSVFRAIPNAQNWYSNGRLFASPATLLPPFHSFLASMNDYAISQTCRPQSHIGIDACAADRARRTAVSRRFSPGRLIRRRRRHTTLYRFWRDDFCRRPRRKPARAALIAYGLTVGVSPRGFHWLTIEAAPAPLGYYARIPLQAHARNDARTPTLLARMAQSHFLRRRRHANSAYRDLGERPVAGCDLLRYHSARPYNIGIT